MHCSVKTNSDGVRPSSGAATWHCDSHWRNRERWLVVHCCGRGRPHSERRLFKQALTAVFRIQTIYCYSETERDNAIKELGGKPEITRFKGLGEISPKEFQQFIGKEMRLSKVEYAPRAESGPIFNFYMGKNTPERKDYIMDKLVVPVEE